MKSNKNNAVAAGIFYLIAAASAIIGRLLYDPILQHPEYILQGSAHENQILWGAFLEIITVIAVFGTPIALFPVLRKVNISLSVASVAFRVLEGTMIMLGVLALLTIVSLSHTNAQDMLPDTGSYLLISKSLLALHHWTFTFGPNIALGPSTFMIGYMLYTSGLVPRWIGVTGIVGGPLIFLAGILIMFGVFSQTSMWSGLLTIPVFVYEMSLAIRLLRKGFEANQPEMVTVLR
jgi:hypothetical protein